VELDDVLAKTHAERWADRPDVAVIHDDVLRVTPDRITPNAEELVVVGNIPYNITTPILFHLLVRPRPAVILLMVQKEVADRMLAEPGTRGYGALTVGVRTVATVERVLSVPSGAFRPRPKVDSAVVRITPIHPAPLTLEEEGALRTLTRALFQWRRKQLGKSLRDHPDLQHDPATIAAALGAVGVEPRARPEVLSPSAFVALSRALSSSAPEAGPGPGPGHVPSARR
jgi:16S rRNA (adenine1518-N6/adenine1519-N6)-dimethyltransferase